MDNTHLPAFMTKTNTLLKGNNGGQGFFVGSKVRCPVISKHREVGWRSESLPMKIMHIHVSKPSDFICLN